MTDDTLRAALDEWDAIEGSDLAAQFQAFIAAGKMADAIRAALAAPAPDVGNDAYQQGWDAGYAVADNLHRTAHFASAPDEGPRLDTPEQTHSVEYNRGWADGNASALDACNPVIERLQTELAARPAAPVALDEAWRKAEQAVPDGWELWGVRRRIGKGHGPNGACEAWAGPPGIPEKAVHGYGQQPAEALLSLARKLAFRSKELTDDR